MSASVYAGLAVTSHNDSVMAAATFDNVSIAALPSPWTSADIGAVAAAGSTAYNSGTFTIDGSGADIWGSADEFHYVYQTATGDCDIIARVTAVENTNSQAKVGLMIRETTANNSLNAAALVTPTSGLRFQRRTSTGGTTANTNASGYRRSHLAAPHPHRQHVQGLSVHQRNHLDPVRRQPQFHDGLHRLHRHRREQPQRRRPLHLDHRQRDGDTLTVAGFMKPQRILGLGAITAVVVALGAIFLGKPADSRPSGRDHHRREDASTTRFQQPENSQPKSKRTRPPRNLTDKDRLAAANETVRTDPVEALAIAAELPPSAESDELLVRAAAEWTLSEPEQAAAWARQAGDEILRQRLLAAIATHWSERDPVSAANLALEIPAGKPQSDALVGIVQRWVQTDPQAAATWVASFPEGELRRGIHGKPRQTLGQAGFPSHRPMVGHTCRRPVPRHRPPRLLRTTRAHPEHKTLGLIRSGLNTLRRVPFR